MKKLTRTIAAVSALAMSVGALSACGGSNVNADKGHVYFLSMKVEQQDQFKELAEKFTKKTGIQVDIATASSDTYEQSLKSELAKSEAPTLFDVDNNDFLNWTDYYADMSGTNIYKDQENPDYALKDGDTVGAVPYVMERYGIIYNKKLLQKYFDSSWASIKSVDSINNFKTLKTVADEIQAHKDEMGVKGAFTSAGFDTSSIKRFGDQLAHISVYYEYRDQGVTQMPATIPTSTYRTSRTFSTCTSTTPRFRRRSSPVPPWTTPTPSSHWVRPCSCRMALGAIRRFAIKRSPMKIWAYCRSIWV